MSEHEHAHHSTHSHAHEHAHAEHGSHEHHVGHEHKPRKHPIDAGLLKVTLAVLVGAFIILNIYFAVGIQQQINSGFANTTSGLNVSANQSTGAQNNSVATPTADVAQFTAIRLVSAECSDCGFADQVLQSILSASADLNLEITGAQEVVYSSGDGLELVRKYNITKVPTLILVGDSSKAQDFVAQWAQLGTIEPDGALVLRNVLPPFVNASTGAISGHVSSTELYYPDCAECSDASILLEQIRQLVSVTEEKRVSALSPEGVELVSRYNVTKFPTLLLSKGLNEYASGVIEMFTPVGTFEQDGTYVLRSILPPYFDSEKNRTVGLVDAVYLVDASCAECYSVDLHKQATSNVNFVNSTTLDVSSPEAAALVATYNISLVPTVLYSPELIEYEAVGFGSYISMFSVEDDGWLVFRDLDAVPGGSYKNLVTGEVLNSTTPAQLNAGV